MVGVTKDDDDGNEKEAQPLWLHTDNDELHRQEIAPLLFGIGTRDLEKGNENINDDHDHDDDEEEEKQEEEEIDGQDHLNKHNKEDKEEEYHHREEDDTETAVLSAASGNSKKTYGSMASSKSDKSNASSTFSGLANNWATAKQKLGLITKKKSGKTKNNTQKLDQTNSEYGVDEEADNLWPNTTSPIKVDEKTGRPKRPRRGWCLNVFHFVEACSILACLCIFLSQTLPMIVIPLSEIQLVDLLLKIYNSLFSILFIIVEYDFNIELVRKSVFLQTYSSRGLIYSFLGLTCLEEAYSERVNDILIHANERFHISWFALFLQISAWSLCYMGVLYFVMGLFCLKRLRDKLVKEYRLRWRKYRVAMKDWQKHDKEDE